MTPLRQSAPCAQLFAFVLSAVLTGQLTCQAPPPPGELPRLPKGQLAEVEKVGTGDRVLVMLPCMSGRWRTFDTFMQRNSSRYTMYAVTVPGYGGTPFPEIPSNTTGTPWRTNAIAGLEKLFRDAKIRQAALVGHSWGTSLAVEFAARHPKLVSHIVNLDGFLHQSPNDEKRSTKERLRQAGKVITHWGSKLADAEAWRRFNGCSIPAPDRRMLHHGMFMATDRRAMLQYWRENPIARINDLLRRVKCPILDIHTLVRGTPNRDQRARERLDELVTIGVAKRVQTVTWFDVGHFVHELKPTEVDVALEAFFSGKPVRDDLKR